MSRYSSLSCSETRRWNSPKVYTNRIDIHADTVVERLENNTVGGAFDYTFTSPIETEYLVRTASEDGKEGWQYVRVFLPVHNLNTYEHFASSDISIKRHSSL
jgi:hypothetical protein